MPAAELTSSGPYRLMLSTGNGNVKSSKAAEAAHATLADCTGNAILPALRECLRIVDAVSTRTCPWAFAILGTHFDVWQLNILVFGGDFAIP